MATEMTPPPRTRESSGDKQIYTAQEVGEMRADWERSQREEQLKRDLSKLQGQFDGLPAIIESVARRVFQEMWQTAQQQAAQTAQSRTNQSWRRADTIIALGQFLLAAAVFVALKF